MALSLLFKQTKASVGLVQFDATLSESHSKAVQLTDHPVELGANITDHIRRQPEEISITGVVTNTPLVYAASLRSPSPIINDLTFPEERAELAYAELQRVMNDGELVTVVTTIKEYENMAITSLSVDRNAATGDVLSASLSLREVIKVETETVAAPEPEAEANQKPKDTGKQVPKEAPAPVAQSSSSTLASLFGL